MKNRQLLSFYTFLLFFAISFLSSCNRDIPMQTGDFKIKSQSFAGNKTIATEYLEGLIPPTQQPNTTVLGLPFSPKVQFYFAGKFFYSDVEMRGDIAYYKQYLERKGAELSSRKISRINSKILRKEQNLATQSNFIMRFLGEPPAVTNDEKVRKTTKNIENYFRINGFKDAKVNYSISFNNNGAGAIKYEIFEGIPYLLSSYQYEVDDQHIDSLLKSNHDQNLIEIGGRFIEKKFNDEAEIDELDRIESLLRNNGYFDFRKDSSLIKVIASVDTSIKTKEFVPIDVKLVVKANKLKQFYINEIKFNTQDPYNKYDKILIDSTQKDGIDFIFRNFKYPTKLIANKILIEKNQLYNQKIVENTQRRLFQIDQFGTVDLNFKKVDSNKVDININAPVLYRFTFNNELNGNLIQDVPGIGLSGTLNIRNVLKQLETIENSVRIATEGQPSTIGISRSFEIGLNTSINFPTLVTPFDAKLFKKFENPRTQLKVGYNYSNQASFERTNFNFGLNYSFNPSNQEQISFSFLDLGLLNANVSAEFANTLNNLEKQGSNLKVQFGRQFVSNLNFNYSFNSSIEGKNVRSKFYKIGVESGGTSLPLFANNQIGILSVIGGDSLAFFQYLKANLDYRKYIPLTLKNTLALRGNFGIAYPYGKNKSLPFEKNFYVGGSSSIRAWTPRSLGPGASPPIKTSNNNNRLIIQPGDILLEGSVEHRHFLGRFYGDIYGAAFLDFGNVWKWYNDPLRQDLANFQFNRFWKQIAVGSGYGIRYDLGYFVFRIDSGIKIYDPSEQKNGFVIKEVFIRRSSPKRIYKSAIINWFNFGIGYPF